MLFAFAVGCIFGALGMVVAKNALVWRRWAQLGK